MERDVPPSRSDDYHVNCDPNCPGNGFFIFSNANSLLSDNCGNDKEINNKPDKKINPALRFKSMVFYLFYGAAIAFLALFIMGCVAYFFINPAVAFIAVGSFFLIFTCIFIVYFIGHKNDKHIIIDKIFDIIKGLLSKLGFNL